MLNTIANYLQNLEPDLVMSESQILVLFLMSKVAALHTERKDFDSAIHWMKHLTELMPDQPLPHADLAYLFGLKSDFVEAVKHSQKAVDLGHHIFEVYQIHGDVLLTNKRLAAMASLGPPIPVRSGTLQIHSGSTQTITDRIALERQLDTINKQLEALGV